MSRRSQWWSALAATMDVVIEVDESLGDTVTAGGDGEQETLTESMDEAVRERNDPIPHRMKWQLDTESDACASCNKSFGVITRRHHCRVCGKLVCAACSSSKADLSCIGFTGFHRVCDDCIPSIPRNIIKNDLPPMPEPSLPGDVISMNTIALFDGQGKVVGKFPCTLSTTHIEWEYPEGVTKTPILKSDVIAIEYPEDSLDIVVHSFPKKNEKRKHRIVGFRFSEAQFCDRWREGLADYLEDLKPRKILLFVNPFGGTKIAPKIWNDVRYVFDLAGHDITEVETTHIGHAKEYVIENDVSQFDSIVTVSGDGVLCEVANGIMLRDDWQTVSAAVTIGVIPGGSGNGLAKMLKISDTTAAAFAICKGIAIPLDLIRMTQPETDLEPFYSFLSVNWGIVSDVDFESEQYRFMGNARFTVGAVVRLVNLRTYPGRVSYIPIQKDREAAKLQIPASHCQVCSLQDCQNCCSTQVIYVDNDTSMNEMTDADSSEWQVVEDDFIMVVGCNVAWISSDVNMAPYAHLSDGAIDLVFVRQSSGRGDLISMFVDLETGDYVNSKAFSSKESAFEYHKLEALCENGSFGIDGERVPSYTPMHCKIVPGVLNILC